MLLRSNLVALLAVTAFALISTPADAAWHGSGDRVRTVATSAAAAAPLPRDTIVAPGLYRIGRLTYDMRHEGYYRLGSRQRIVFARDVGALISGVAWSTTNGGGDDPTDLDGFDGGATERTMALRRPDIQCGYVVEVTR
jgi:hypothetical protein